MSIDVAAIYSEHAAPLRGYIARRLRGADDATIEDLVADVFERVVRSAPRYQDRGAPAEAWLRRIARNLLTDRYREGSRRVRMVPLDVVRPMITHVGTDDHVAQIHARAAVSRAMGRLNDAQRSVAVARYLDRRSIQETAVATGHTEGGVKKLQERALVNMRRALGAA